LLCSKCFGPTVLRKVKTTGTLVEFANSFIRSHEGIFGIIQMDGFRLIGSLDDARRLHKGIKVKLEKCGINDEGIPFYHFSSTTK
jgi:uncharacterized OB-fold protein